MSSSSDSILTRTADIDLLRLQMSSELRQLSHEKDNESLRQWIVVRMGSMVFVGFGLMLAVMKLWFTG